MDNILVFRTGLLGTWREKFAGVADFARTAGWRLQPVDARTARPDVGALVDFWRPRGAIVDASGAPGRLRPRDFGALPVVFMTPSDPDGAAAPSVSSDSREIAAMALAELLSADPASLLFVDWFSPCQWAVAKREHARKAAALHGLPFAVVSPPSGSGAVDATATERLVAEKISSMPLPCGVFAVTDAMGAAALSAAARLGLEVPGDVSVVAVDDDPEVCENTFPTLSSVRPDFHRLGFAAGALLRREIGFSGEQNRSGRAQTFAHETIPPVGVVRRASTRSTRRRDRKAELALETIRRKACEGLRPVDVATIFGGSRRMAEIRFKAATGRTISEELLETRLAAACDLLRAGRVSVGAIANFCGWSGDLAFRKAFKARFGLPPLRWAKTRRNGASE